MKINAWNKSNEIYLFPLDITHENSFIKTNFGWMYKENKCDFISGIPVHDSIQTEIIDPDLTIKNLQAMIKDIFEELPEHL